MTADVFIPQSMTLTDAAASKVRELIEAEHNPAMKLRVYVTGGGCSGFQYGFDFDEQVQDDDTVIEKDGVQMVIDPMSYPYLVGSVVDYQAGLQGAQFIVNNPNATTTCGCGSSFTI